MVVVKFDGEHRFLSNFYPAKTRYERMTYPTAEHAFQAAKTLDLTQRRRVQAEPTPSAAKYAGRRLRLRSDWDAVKDEVMYACLKSKFHPTRNPYLAQKLVATYPDVLVEGNTWNDRYWGAVWMTRTAEGEEVWAWDRNVPLCGRNQLGILLMRLRDKVGEILS